MPSFGSRKTAAPSPEPAPMPAEQSAAERLTALLSEQAQITATLGDHQQQRARAMRENATLDAIRALTAEDDKLRLRLEQIGVLLPDAQQAVEREHHAAWEAEWETHRPGLMEAETQLAQAIRDFHVALTGAHQAHNAAAAHGFSGKLVVDFVAPPPLAPVYNDWSLREYLATIARRQQAAQAAAPAIELAVLPDTNALWAPRFTPRRVPRDLVEQVSPLQERRIRVLHAFNCSNLNFGHRKLEAGTEMSVPAPAAFAMTYAGVAEYLDEAVTAPAA